MYIIVAQVNKTSKPCGAIRHGLRPGRHLASVKKVYCFSYWRSVLPNLFSNLSPLVILFIVYFSTNLTISQIPLARLFASIASNASVQSRARLTRWCASFIAGWFSMRLLQTKQGEAFVDHITVADGVSVKSRVWAGRTMDLTLFAVVRALDVSIGELWARRKAFKVAVNRWKRVDELVGNFTDPALFAASSALVMVRTIFSFLKVMA